MIERAAIGPDLDALRDGALRWTGLRPAEKARLLAEVAAATAGVAARWTAVAAQAKGIAGTPLAGEEAISGPWALLYALNRYIRTLDQIAATGRPRIPAKRVRQRSDGRTVVEVFPETLYDALLLNGVRAEVWMQDGVTPANLSETLGPWYAQPDPQPRVALVLGAGNIASIPPLDVLYKLVADGAVCALKVNPVNG